MDNRLAEQAIDLEATLFMLLRQAYLNRERTQWRRLYRVHQKAAARMYRRLGY